MNNLNSFRADYIKYPIQDVIMPGKYYMSTVWISFNVCFHTFMYVHNQRLEVTGLILAQALKNQVLHFQ